MTRGVLVVLSAFLLAAFGTGCKSASEKCLGTGYAFQSPEQCELACNDESLERDIRSESCFMLVMIYDNGDTKYQDPTKVGATIKRACAAGHSASCRRAPQ